LCFNINSVESRSIKPEKENFLGTLEFIGRKMGENAAPDGKTVILPNGNYLFAQKRCPQALSQTEWLDIAIEQQKDGLWEQNKLGCLLYIRYLFEDGAFVTQIFREIIQ